MRILLGTPSAGRSCDARSVGKAVHKHPVIQGWFGIESLEQRHLLSTVSFQPVQTYATGAGSTPRYVTVADVNGDPQP